MKLHADRIVSVSAIIVSVATLIMILYQTNLVRKEQKASVMPYLKISFSNSSINGAPYQQIQLTNKGLGPAKIELVQIVTPGDTLDMNPLQYFRTRIQDSVYKKVMMADMVTPGRMIAPQEFIVMLRFSNEQGENLIINNFKFPQDYSGFIPVNNSSSLVLQITYSSVYGDRWTVRSDEQQPREI